jgi:hypothetical protein
MPAPTLSLTYTGPDGPDGFTDALVEGVRGALRQLGLPEPAVSISNGSAPGTLRLATDAATVDDPGMARSAFGLVAGWRAEFPADPEAVMAELDRVGAGAALRFAEQWARLLVTARPELLLVDAVYDALGVAPAGTVAGDALRTELGYLLSWTAYPLAPWIRYVAEPRSGRPDDALRWVELTSGAAPATLDLHAGTDTAALLVRRLHAPGPRALERSLDAELGRAAMLLPVLRVCVDDTVRPECVEVRAGGRTVAVLALPQPDDPAAVSRMPFRDEFTGAIRDRIAVLLAGRQVGRLLDELSVVWDPDLVAVLRSEASDEIVTLALRRSIGDDPTLSFAPTLLRELAAAAEIHPELRITRALEEAARSRDALAADGGASV